MIVRWKGLTFVNRSGLRATHREALAERLARAGFDGVDIGAFRRYGSARKLYHFHVDNVGRC